jgi:hypothetical protein
MGRGALMGCSVRPVKHLLIEFDHHCGKCCNLSYISRLLLPSLSYSLARGHQKDLSCLKEGKTPQAHFQLAIVTKTSEAEIPQLRASWSEGIPVVLYEQNPLIIDGQVHSAQGRAKGPML